MGLDVYHSHALLPYEDSWDYYTKELLILKRDEAQAQLKAAQFNLYKLQSDPVQAERLRLLEGDEVELDGCILRLQAVISDAEARITGFDICLAKINEHSALWSHEIGALLQNTLSMVNPFEEAHMSIG